MTKQKELAEVLDKWQKRFGAIFSKSARKHREPEYGPSQSAAQALKIETEVKKGLK